MDVEGERGHNVDEVQGEGFADRVMEKGSGGMCCIEMGSGEIY